MATVDEDLKTFLQTNAPLSARVAGKVYENYIHQNIEPPFIYFAQTGEIRADALADPVGTLPIGYEFALEVVARTIRDARVIGALVVNCLHLLTKSTFGSRTIQVVFVEDQSDQYVPQSGAVDRGFHISAYSVQVYL